MIAPFFIYGEKSWTEVIEIALVMQSNCRNLKTGHVITLDNEWRPIVWQAYRHCVNPVCILNIY